MHLIVGLGNPEEKYKDTRHNIGYSIIDSFRTHHQDLFQEFSLVKKNQTLISEGMISDRKIFLAKPNLYMNQAGIAIKKTLDFYKISPSQMIVIQDDSDLFVGKMKIKKDVSSAGHKGIESINQMLKNQNYLRILIGIRDPELDEGKKSLDFVLKTFPSNRKEIIEKIKSRAIRAIEFLLQNPNLQKAQSLFNQDINV
jgi:peptidyl-tRNA hydrolase, PTH1 family